MSYDLGSYDPASGAIVAATDLGGFSLKRALTPPKKIRKVLKKAAPLLAVASLIPAVAVVKKIEAVKKVNDARNKVKNKAKQLKAEFTPQVAAPPPPMATLPDSTVNDIRAGSRNSSGVSLSSRAKARRHVLKRTTDDAAASLGVKPKGGKISTLPVQANAAGIKFRKRHKKNGKGTEVVATDANGAVVSGPIPQSTLDRTGATIEAAPPLPADAVQAAPPPIPSVADAQGMIANAMQNSVPSVSSVASPPTPTDTQPQTDNGFLSNPLLLVGGAAAAAYLVMGRR